jgi:hypothetical protein
MRWCLLHAVHSFVFPPSLALLYLTSRVTPRAINLRYVGRDIVLWCGCAQHTTRRATSAWWAPLCVVRHHPALRAVASLGATDRVTAPDVDVCADRPDPS